MNVLSDMIPQETSESCFGENHFVKNLSASLFCFVLCLFLCNCVGNKEPVVKFPGTPGIVTLPGNVDIEMVRVESEPFMMCERDSENATNEKEHYVRLTREFWIGKTEVTQAQWKAVMGTNPAHFQSSWGKIWTWFRDDRPVECVSWNDCKEFCKKLNQMCVGRLPVGYQFDLPTEAQWEFASRGGQKNRGYRYSGSNDIDDLAWYWNNSGAETHTVGKKAPNQLELFDMSGNVWEWCRDSYEENCARDPEFLNGNEGTNRVYRGGCWHGQVRSCRSAFRAFGDPATRANDLGFRLALVPVQK